MSIFDISVYYSIIANVILTQEEKTFLNELYNNNLGNDDCVVKGEDVAKLMKLYKLAIKVMQEDIINIQRRIDLIEE